ncbi:unnamed protein product [Adineta ricciae]|uniref:ubiquitinyl hydrolase 1 n=1 Tax=Adineta ricciae TaxID=249248 RepID=A0A815QQT9_ADIRI|nr:unnamed protein product [Adineta ricciae]
MNSQEVDESILNHLFLPHGLSSSASSDHLIQSDHQNEYKLLQCMNNYWKSLDENNQLPIFSTLKTCTERWSTIQNTKKCSISVLQSIIQKLSPGDFLPLYFYAQNAAILIEIDENSPDQPLISSWQVLLPTNVITSSLEPHVSCFPVSTFRLPDRCQLSSTVHCELLSEFMNNTIEHSKSHKASYTFDETREVPISHYVCQWWTTHFQGVQIDNKTNASVSFKKKHRDQIRYKNSAYPFRRSGLWMAVKVVFQNILTKRMGTLGHIVYKLIITDFLTNFIHTRKERRNSSRSTDVLVHCLRKIVRRLNKIDVLLLSVDSSNINPWIQNTIERIKQKVNSLTPNSDWQEAIEKVGTKEAQKVQLNSRQFEIYQHPCRKLKAYLEKDRPPTSNRYSYDHQLSANIAHNNDQLPQLSTLINYDNDATNIALARVELWIQTNLEKWINRCLLSTNKYTCFENLQTFYEDYQRRALDFHAADKQSTDATGYSRFIIASLTIIRLMHMKLCEDSRFERLKLHAIQIPNLLKLFEFLVLPNQDDMIRARELYDYFLEFSRKPYPHLLNKIDCPNAFGVYFAENSVEMNENLKQIQEQVAQDKEDKTKEITNAIEKYEQLMEKVNNLKCECDSILIRYRKCDRCTMIKEAESIKVTIYECPIPSQRYSALAVMFELQMPKEIRCYRDILWQFINRPKSNPSNSMHEWLSTRPHQSKLGKYFNGSRNCKVKLVSETKSISECHYSAPRHVISTPLEEFFYDNSLKVQISPNKLNEFQDECQTLTPKLTDSNYKDLQFSIMNTEFVQNQVIAELSKCSLKLNLTEFIEYGSFRSGHRLQWWNLLSILELDSLSMDEESVVILITHSLLQYGPVNENPQSLTCSWCPESHQQLLEDDFLDELIIRLDRHLKDCESNWQNELLLVIITIIVMRMFTICNSTRKEQMTNLVLKCRKTGKKWIERISETIQTSSDCIMMNGLRDKIIVTAMTYLLTFSIYSDSSNTLVLTSEDVVSLLTIATTMHDNSILNKKTAHMSIFMRNIMRYSEYVLLSIHPIISKLLEESSYESLNQFCAIHWAVLRTKGTMNGKWKKRNNDMYDGWYDGEYESNKLSIDCIRGSFFVNKMTIGFLPDRITSDELFRRVFGTHIFEVQAAESEDSYITKYGYHDNGEVHYEFIYNDSYYGNRRLTVYERHLKTKEKFELIPSSCFEGELSDIFVSNYSHWRDIDKNQIEFRPIHFQDSNFLTDKQYILTMQNGYFTMNNLEDMEILINRSSSFFQSLFTRYFIRLDEESYVYMIRQNGFVHIHLPRLGIAFKYDFRTRIVTSREYSEMYVDENQSFGTLTGLKSGLLLSPIGQIHQNNTSSLYRKLIVPFGLVQATKTSENGPHQMVTIDRKSSTSMLHQYFIFVLNDRLRVLQPTDSPTGWFYLALLHAMTSHPLPDRYTGMTGMERAFQLLYSAGCWSNQSYDSITRHILLQIATISPKVSFYPEHLTCMAKVDWNENSLPYSMQHFGYYLIVKKLVETSEEWNFMHSLVISNDELHKLFQSKKYNEKLLGKLYWDYRDSYNPTARLSEDMEKDIRQMSSTQSFQPVSNNSSYSTNYNSCRLVDYLYGSGDVDLKHSKELHCFPLSRWLKDEYQLKHTWIGLLKFAEDVKALHEGDNHKNAFERFEILLDFLYYISDRCSSKPYYLQMLKSFLRAPTTTAISFSYPTFTAYVNIQETTVQTHRINLGKMGHYKRAIVFREIQDCFNKNSMYENNDLPSMHQLTRQTNRINRLLQSWRDNGKLRLFLDNVQDHFRSISITPLNLKVYVIPQLFEFESFQAHFQVRITMTDTLINLKSIEDARAKFLHPHSNYFIKPNMCIPIKTEKKTFPEDIFPSIDSQVNPFSDITDYFKKHLTESWNKFNLTEEYQQEFPSLEQIEQFLDRYRQESKLYWDELVQSIRTANDLLVKVGLVVRILPTILISIFQQTWLSENHSNILSLHLTHNQCILLGGIMVNWIVEQQIERALNFADLEKWEEFEKEMLNVPHINWTPSEHIPWLILELEMNITIREVQVQVARHMTQPLINENSSSVRNIVMQMNMGEGKTSVILPMLAVSLCSSASNLVRIIVLKALFPMNYQSLRYKLGGLLNRHVIPFACRRDMNFNDVQANQIFNRFKQAIHNLDVILTSPEDILSFDLLTIDKCRRNEYDVGGSMLSIQSWVKKYVRDVLDESDEILHVKYQLIYSIGRQLQVDGGIERWKTIQYVLNLVKQHAASIAQQYKNDIFYQSSKRQSSFPEFRLLSHLSYSELCRRVANDWINQKSYRQLDQQRILSFILDTSSSIDSLLNQFPESTNQLLLILRGLLSSEVLFVALKKRYRVNFGINSNTKFNRLMAVPFRAKDVAAENTEFGHPDVAIVLTQLSYYYQGLTDPQMYQCFNRLNQDENEPEMIYDQWISLEEETDIIASIKQWKKINLRDYQQRTQLLFPSLRYNMLVINYFLNHFVFPREAKQFPQKLVASAWDLSSSFREKTITGFSGTNDTQLLLPVHIRQCDLPELRQTDAIVLNNLLRSENDHYQDLPIATNTDEILKRIVSQEPMIQVILDVGALLIDGTNRQTAIKWLDLSDRLKIDYVVYFESDSIFVCNRQHQHHALATSPASERLDRCVFYLDEIHTRGTDFKFPNEFRAAVTLGSGLTKDRLVQACMRMRKLGKHHWLSFWSSSEVHQQIRAMKNHGISRNKMGNGDEQIVLTDVLRWVYGNTQQATWDGLHLWATQSLSFQRKLAAFRNIDLEKEGISYTSTTMDNIARGSLEAEVIELKSMYGVSKTLETISDIYSARYKHFNIFFSTEIHEAVSKRLRDYGGSKKLLTQLLDEEQQRELEREQELEEERQQKRPSPVRPVDPQLHDEIKALCNPIDPMLNLSKTTSVFHPISDAFLGTTFHRECQPHCWPKNFWVTDEFVRVVQAKGESLDPFLRPMRWILIYRDEHVIFVSAFEANWIMDRLHALHRQKRSREFFTTTLRLILPRIKREQSIIANIPTLTVPPSNILNFSIPFEWLAILFIFNGTLYFKSENEQDAYCRCLGICPKPRTEIEETAFENGWIAFDGFVKQLEHRSLLRLHECHFCNNPLTFMRKLIEIRNNTHAPLTSHVGSILTNTVKLPVE